MLSRIVNCVKILSHRCRALEVDEALSINLKTVPSGSQEVPHSGRGQQGPVLVVAGHDQGRHEAHHLVEERLLAFIFVRTGHLETLSRTILLNREQN